MHSDNIVRKVSSTITSVEEFETTLEAESEYYSAISSEINKEANVKVERDKAEVMKDQFHVVKYKQIIPNWNVFNMKMRNHISIVEKYLFI